MQLKETKNLTVPSDLRVSQLIGKNDSDNKKLYEVLYTVDDKEPNFTNDAKNDKDLSSKIPSFGNVTTLEWIGTWRAIETDQEASSEPGK